MAKHLFLEGPIQSGKSTLIKNCLREFGGTPGGFSCKRYLDESGSIRAFGLVSPTDFDVDGVYDPQIHGDPEPCGFGGDGTGQACSECGGPRRSGSEGSSGCGQAAGVSRRPPGELAAVHV